jgi:hypothetical protein
LRRQYHYMPGWAKILHGLVFLLLVIWFFHSTRGF